MEDTHYLFCYGSNNPQQLKERLGRTVTIKYKAKALRKKRFFTNSYAAVSQGKGGVVTMLPGDVGDTVLGYVTEVTENELKILDIYEGVQYKKYERIILTVHVRENSGREYPISVFTYVMTKDFIENRSVGKLKPSSDYLRKIVETVNGAGWRKRDGSKFCPEDFYPTN